MINVQFSDLTPTAVIISYYGTRQNPDYYPNMGEVEATDPRWREFYNNAPPDIRPLLPTPEEEAL